MRHALSLSFSGFFLDKCDSIRQRSSGEIFIGGLITIIGRAVGLDFPDPEYIPVDTPPNFLLDCDTLIRMEMLLDRGTRTYSWLDADKAPVYILPSWIGSHSMQATPTLGSSRSIDPSRCIPRIR
ncbi:unnamed protein product [Lactuca saligna]|nr:unnamed protein product [Lactuca saligna]